MLRLIGLLTLVVIVWLAVSSGLITKLRPYIERAVVVSREVAGNMQRRLEGFEEDKRVMPLDGEEVTSEGHVATAEDPYQRLIAQGVVTEEFRDKGPTALEGTVTEEPVAKAEPYETTTVEGEQAKKEEFPEPYEEAKRKLLEAMTLLEGAGNGT